MAGLMAMGKGDIESARADFEQALALAEVFVDSDLLALALLGAGQSLVQLEKSAEGVARLDEAMVGVAAGQVSPVLAGIIYCAVILICQRLFDLRRAREWTTQLDAWCASQPDLVPYRGQCLVHRSEILQLQGTWPEALAEVMRAREHLADRSDAVVGRACYQQGELHRLRGEFAQAEEMYREASRNGCEPQPGVSLLRLAEGKLDAAAAAIRLAIGTHEGTGPGSLRIRLLGPSVEILIASRDVDAARAAAEELTRVAAAFVFSMHDVYELSGLMRGGGFHQVDVQARPKTLRLPPPAPFLRQYIRCTPIADAVAAVGDAKRKALERDICERWREFVVGDSMLLEVGMTTAIGLK